MRREEVALQVYPNPFSNNFTVDYALPTTSQVTVYLMDVLGREVQQLLPSQQQASGFHQLVFQNTIVDNGIFFLVVQVDQTILQEKVILNR